MERWQVKKTIALYLVIVYGLLSLIGFYFGKQIPSDFNTLCSMIIAFYFGRGFTSESK